MTAEDRMCGLTLVVAGVLLAAALWFAAGCGGAARPCPIAPPIEVQHVRVDCLKGPPPAPPGDAVALAGPPACPDGFAACLSADSLRALAGYLADVQRYAQDAWTNCGPIPEDPED